MEPRELRSWSNNQSINDMIAFNIVLSLPPNILWSACGIFMGGGYGGGKGRGIAAGLTAAVKKNSLLLILLVHYTYNNSIDVIFIIHNEKKYLVYKLVVYADMTVQSLGREAALPPSTTARLSYRLRSTPGRVVCEVSSKSITEVHKK